MTKIYYRPENARRSDGIFYETGNLMLLKGGKATSFIEADAADQREYLDSFLRDSEAHSVLLNDFKLTGFTSCYRQYLFCKCGACCAENCPTKHKLCNDHHEKDTERG